jgi:hypothetical protein
MSETPEAPEGTEGEQPQDAEPTYQRTFYPTDYQRFARTVKQVRADAGDERADALAQVITAQLLADNPDFEVQRFMSATREHPAYYGQLASHVRQARHVKCQSYTAKSEAMQVGVDNMEQALGEFLSQDPGFDPDLFHTSAAHPGDRFQRAGYGGMGLTGGDDD